MADNLLDKASILLTPTAYNDGSMLSIKPENGDGDFTFSRSSAATRVNAQGLVENVQIISSELVSNGNFSQIGTEEVSNGNFSQIGSELVTNGDFATDSDWTKLNATISGGKGNLDGDGQTSLLYQNILTQNKSYKATFTVSNYNGLGGSAIINSNGDNYYTITENGTFTIFFKHTYSNGLFYFRAINGAIYSIDNVSVKEVGQDWTLGTGWSIGDGKAVANVSGTQAIYQSGITLNKYYKVTYTISNYVSGDIRVRVGTSSIPTVRSSNGTFTEYLYATGASQVRISPFTSGFIGSITNVSVKEVGQDWTLGTGWSIGDSKAIYTGTANANLSQNNVLASGKKYKLQYNVISSTLVNGIVKLSGTTSAAQEILSQVEGEHSLIFTADGSDSTNLDIRIVINTSGQFDISNISVKEITDDTDLPRINYEGFSYQDSLGSELVVNGDFSNGSANWVNNNSSLSIESGKLKVSSTSGYGNAEQNISVEGGKTYEVSADFTYGGTTEGRLNLYDGSATPMEISKSEDGIISTQITISSGQTNLRIRLVNQSATIGVYNLWNNVSVKEYLGQEVVPDSGCGSWLLEPQSTNLIPYSSDFSRSNWVKVNNAIVSATKVISPDGTLNASQIIFDGTSQGRIEDAIPSLIQGADYTVSVYARVSSGTQAVRLGSVNDFEYTLTTEWQRLTSTEVENDTVGYPRFKCNDAATIEIWGFQLENQSFSTSYIPSSGAASTRLQDIANNSGNSTLINSTEGVLYFEGSYPKTTSGSGNKRIAISDGTSSNRVMFAEIGNTGLGALITSQGVNSAYITGSLDNLSNFKAAISYKQNDFALWINGLKVAIDTSGNVPIGLNEIAFDGGDGTNDFYGKNKALAVYKEALTDANLRSLTYPSAVATTFDLDFDTIAEQFTFTRGSEAAFVNAQGLIESTASNDAPRIDYSTGAKAFLLENQSTNLVTYSEDFSQFSNISDVSITTGFTAPDGTNTASKIVSSGGNAHIAGYNGINTGKRKSIYARTVSGTGKIHLLNTSSDTNSLFDLTDQWQRFDITHSEADFFYAADFRGADVTLSEVLIWGAQLEQQSYATSYIPTSGASATRNQELCNNATPVINSEEGTLYAEISALADDLSFRVVSISDGTNNNTIKLGYRSDTNAIYVEVKSASVGTVFLVYTTTSITDFHKIAFKYRLNDFSLWIDGVNVLNDSSGSVPIGLSQLSFNRGDVNNSFFGNTKGLKYYPKALADVQLEDLTTI